MKDSMVVFGLALMAVSGFAQSLEYPGAWTRSFSQAGNAAAGGKPADYQEGLRALDEQEWQAAAAAFARVAERRGPAADGALYWKAYAESRAGYKQTAVKTLERLRQTMPDSKWLQDAAALDAEMQAVKLSGGNFTSASLTTQSADTDIKLLAINKLMLSKPAVAVPALKNLLAGSSAVAVKDRALFVLAQSASPEAQRVVSDLAKNAGETGLRIRAIRYVGMNGDEGAHELVQIYGHEENGPIRSAILRSLSMGKYAKLLADLAQKEKDPQRKAEIARYLVAVPPEENK